jgi:hypothetical protein
MFFNSSNSIETNKSRIASKLLMSFCLSAATGCANTEGVRTETVNQDTVAVSSLATGENAVSATPVTESTSSSSLPPVTATYSLSAAVLDTVRARYLPTCGDRQFIVIPGKMGGAIAEVRGFSNSHHTVALDEAGKLNGVQWIVEVNYNYRLERHEPMVYRRVGEPIQWTDWQSVEGKETAAGAIRIRDRGGDHEVNLQGFYWISLSDSQVQVSRNAFNCEIV